MSTLPSINYPTNISRINVATDAPYDTTKYFNNYYDIPPVVSSNIDAAILAYFQTITDNAESARILASAVIYTSAKQGVDPMETLKEFKNLPNNELSQYTAMFLNFERENTSFLGIVNRPAVNAYVTRTILP
jgi:hypothetical protein